MLTSVKILDLNFQNQPGVIASYLIPHNAGVILIESGPGSTRDHLTDQLAEHGFRLQDVTDVFLTHIHLDHAGAAGWLSQYGAQIHVHPAGAPHLVDPTRLIASASRIYGDQMETLWGEILPAEPEKIEILADGEPVKVHGIRLLPLDTPGHANHHMVFFYEDICFSGDVGGVRLGGSPVIRAPMPPPEFHLEAWRNSLEKIAAHAPSAIVPTHFGFYQDPKAHLDELNRQLDGVEQWMNTYLASNLTLELLKGKFAAWIETSYQEANLPELLYQAYELANPSSMSFDGILRYWRKFRQGVK